MMGKAALNIVTKDLMLKPTLRNDVSACMKFIQDLLTSDISENHIPFIYSDPQVFR